MADGEPKEGHDAAHGGVQFTVGRQMRARFARLSRSTTRSPSQLPTVTAPVARLPTSSSQEVRSDDGKGY